MRKQIVNNMHVIYMQRAHRMNIIACLHIRSILNRSAWSSVLKYLWVVLVTRIFGFKSHLPGWHYIMHGLQIGNIVQNVRESAVACLVCMKTLQKHNLRLSSKQSQVVHYHCCRIVLSCCSHSLSPCHKVGSIGCCHKIRALTAFERREDLNKMLFPLPAIQRTEDDFVEQSTQ